MSDHDLRVRLAYGEHGLDVDLPSDRTTVVEPTYVAAAEDQRSLLRDALRDPVPGRRCANGSGPARPWRSPRATAPGRSRGT